MDRERKRSFKGPLGKGGLAKFNIRWIAVDTVRTRRNGRWCVAMIALTGALVAMADDVSAQTDAGSEQTASGPSHLNEAEMWVAMEQSVESMCMCLGQRGIEEEMSFEEFSRSPEKLQAWTLEAFSGGRCRPTGILAQLVGLPEESSPDETAERSLPQSKSLWSESHLTAFTAGCVQSIMLPAKRDYMIRAQVSEGLKLAVVAKVAVMETFVATGELPADNETAGLELADRLSGEYVSSVAVNAGNVVIAYGKEAHGLISGQTIVLTPEIQPNNDVIWACSSQSISPQFLPAACR